MKTPGRLRLKAQVIARDHVQALDNPFVRLWVDTGVFHLDSMYDYSVPESLSAFIDVGVRVQVPFNGRELEALVIERVDSSEVVGRIKPVTKILSVYPVATKLSIELISKTAKHWCTNPFDIIRSAIPPRVASIDKTEKFEQSQATPKNKGAQELSFVAFSPHSKPWETTASLASQALNLGSVLVIAPDENDIDAISESVKRLGVTCIRLDSSQSRAQRYANYLRSNSSDSAIVIGARGAVFTPIKDLATIIVYKESSHEHYEIRSPGWNVRDVVNMRRDIEGLNLIFTGYVPSLEISRLIEEKALIYKNSPQRVLVKAHSSDDGALLPGGIFGDIRKALKQGPVLFLAARKGYGNALLCAHCKNLAVCSCGARLSVSAKAAAPTCGICAKSYPSWSCAWCQRNKQYLASRGIERAAEELSRAFPGVPVVLSFGDVIKSHVEDKPSIVIATPGAAPQTPGGYAAVVILEALKLFAHPDLRAQERARELFFETAAMTRSDGLVLLCMDQSHPIVSSLMRWNPSLMIQSELTERSEIPLPPYVSSFVITGPLNEFTSIASGLRKAIQDSRIPPSVKLFGPISLGKSNAKLVLYCIREDARVVTEFLHELQRRRSIAQKEYLAIRVDPYSL